MADQNKVLIRLVYGADHSLSKDSQEYELAEEIRKDEREECIQNVLQQYEGFGKDHQGVEYVKQRIVDAIRERGTT